MLIELSYIISLDMPKWPTNPAERIEYNTVIQNGDPSNASSVFHHLHTGTHVDAPFHFDANGKTIDQIPLYKTISSGNCKRKRGENSI